MTAGQAPNSVGPQPSDPPGWRLLFQLTGGRSGRFWITVWLIIILGSLVLLGMVAGPWVPGAISAVTALTAGGAAVAKHRGRQPPNGP